MALLYAGEGIAGNLILPKTSDKLKTVSRATEMHAFRFVLLYVVAAVVGIMKYDANHVFAPSIVFEMKIKRKRPLEKHTNTLFFSFYLFSTMMMLYIVHTINAFNIALTTTS